MGATDFSTIALGKDAADAFRTARDEAAWESGHGGYTGTIAEKGGFVQFTLKPRTNPLDAIGRVSRATYARHAEQYPEHYGKPKAEDLNAMKWLRERISGVVPYESAPIWAQQRTPSDPAVYLLDTWDDKWGDAVCIEVTGQRAAKVKEQRGRKGTRDKVFLFFGMASC